jgi:hypothetical protein
VLRITSGIMGQAGPKASVHATRITLVGAFPADPDAFSKGPAPTGDEDGLTGFDPFSYSFSSQGPLTVTITVAKSPLRTTYYNGTSRASANTLDGTLGAHEDRHKTFIRGWWTQAHLVDVAKAERMSFDSLPSNKTQADAIVLFLTGLFDAEQEKTVDTDRKPKLLAPVFSGVRYAP